MDNASASELLQEQSKKTGRVNPWTEERIATLRELWDARLSCSQIAAQMGCFTRNAIIGKAARLGLDGRKHGVHPGWTRKVREPKPRVFKPRAKTVIIEVRDEDIPFEQRRDIHGLCATTCRYPVGDPLDLNFFFCGAIPKTDSPYCERHHRIAYRPVKSLEGRAETEKRVREHLRKQRSDAA